MIYWSDEIPADAKKHTLEIIRTPMRKPLQAIVTSEAWIGVFTHFANRRTSPCEGNTCQLCQQGIGNRWHGYVGAYNPKLRQHFLFEFTAGPAEEFKHYIDVQGALRGCLFAAERRGLRANDPVIMRCQPANLDGVQLPDPPNIRRILSIIWALPQTALTKERGFAYAERIGVDTEFLASINGPSVPPAPNGNGKH